MSYKVFDYKCPECKQTAEYMIHSGDTTPVMCPLCLVDMKKLISAPACVNGNFHDGPKVRSK